MLRVGLTGGLGSGKSFVSAALAELGCRVLKADELGHAVLERGAEAYAPVVERFGPEILNADGRIERKRLAAIVFDDAGKLRLLNSLVHPAVVAREEQWLQQVEDADPSAIAVVEAAILIETGSYGRFHKLVLAVCGEAQQIERAMARDGTPRELVLERLRRQMPLEEKKKFADYLIDTSGTTDDTIEQVKRLYESLRSLNV
ncbi:MAG: dephospho-CoA kinase [Bryobacteraceae bacterium]|jgi:dephospho-CoA kinase